MPSSSPTTHLDPAVPLAHASAAEAGVAWRWTWPWRRRALAWGGACLLRLRAGLLAWVRRMGPAELTLYEDAFGHLVTHALRALVTAGAFDALDTFGPQTPEALATRLGRDADVLARLLRFGATRGWVRGLRDGRYALARGGRPLCTTHPATLAPFVDYAGDPASVAAAASAPDVLHLGGSGFVRAHGTSVWRYLAEHPQAGATFDAAMATLSARDVAYVGQALAQLAPGDVCDIAGGTGALLAAALQAQPSVRGTLLERAEVLPHAQRRFAASAFSSRVQLVGGDLFALPPLNARTFVLRNVVHDWDDADVVRLLGQVRQQMGPQHTLALVETLASSTPDAVEALSDVAMLLMTDGGRQRSKAQLCTLAATLGMHCVHDVALPLPMRLLCFRVLGDA